MSRPTPDDLATADPPAAAWVLGALGGAATSLLALGLLFAGALAVLPVAALAGVAVGMLLGRGGRGWALRPAQAALLAGWPGGLLGLWLVPAAWRSSGLWGALVWAAVPVGVAAAGAAGAWLQRGRSAR